jgi:hypothetical protein
MMSANDYDMFMTSPPKSNASRPKKSIDKKRMRTPSPSKSQRQFPHNTRGRIRPTRQCMLSARKQKPREIGQAQIQGKKQMDRLGIEASDSLQEPLSRRERAFTKTILELLGVLCSPVVRIIKPKARNRESNASFFLSTQNRAFMQAIGHRSGRRRFE